MQRSWVVGTWMVCLAAASPAALQGCDGRGDAMRRQVGASDEPKEKVELPDPGPSHEIREQLEPVLSKVYPLNQVPRIVEEEVETPQGYNYALEPGVAAVVRFPPGLGAEERVKAVVTGVAEADAWAFRDDARRPYADLVHRVKRGYGDDQAQQIMKAYAHLRLLDFFNGDEAAAAIDKLPADLQGPVREMQSYYTQNKEKIWEDWMDIKMYARRVVAGDQPFRSVLRDIKKELGKEEPPPRTWEESMDAPFAQWAKQIREDEELLIRLTNLKELREREGYLTDTHSIWAMQGSEKVPDKAKNVKIDKQLGFGVLREDLGGGHNELTFVFPKKLSGNALKEAYLRSIIYGHLLHDFQMLATAGSDYAEREGNVIDPQTSVVPDKYDPLYAKCGSLGATESLIGHFSGEHEFLAGLSGIQDPQKTLKIAHDCLIEGARGDVYIPPKDDETDVQGPAPGSRLAFYQMLSRFEKLDVDMAAMGQKRTEEDEVIDEAEDMLKALKAQQAAAAQEG